MNRVTFYDWETWGHNVPAYRKHPGGGSGIFACGGWYERSSIAAAHRSLPCGTKVQFTYKGRKLVVTVRDRFYGNGFDLTSEACLRLGHCFTGPLKWRIVK